MALDTRQILWRISQAFGAVLIVGVPALLIYLHVFASPEVPRVAPPLPNPHRVIVCDDAPSWVLAELPRAMAFWEKHGVAYGTGPAVACTQTCIHEGRRISCLPGHVIVTLIDGKVPPDHLDETIRYVATDGELGATILVPETLSTEDGHPLPRDIEALVLAHALGHAEGYGHTETEVASGVSAEKTGEIMNAHAEKLGWGDAGLPKK